MKKNLQHALLSRNMDQCDANKQQMATGYTRAFVLHAHVCCQILEILYTFIFMFLEDLLCLYFNFPVVFECWANVFECFTLFSTWFKTIKKHLKQVSLKCILYFYQGFVCIVFCNKNHSKHIFSKNNNADFKFWLTFTRKK